MCVTWRACASGPLGRQVGSLFTLLSTVCQPDRVCDVSIGHQASGSPNAWAVFVTKQLLIAVAAEGTIPDKLGVALSTLCVKLKKGGF